MYYVLSPGTDKEGLLMGFTYQKDHRGRSFVQGKAFTSAPDAKPWQAPPAEPIKLTIDPNPELKGAPLPVFVDQPIPVMSRALYDVIRSAGVDNLDAYRAELLNAEGSLVSDDYVVVNLVGVVRAVDLQNSTFDPNQPDREIAMSFESVAIDPNAAHGFLMFRLVENISTIVVHERVKEAIEAAKLPLVRLHAIGDVALL